MAFKLGYFLRQSSSNLRRNLLMTTAATLTAAVSLLLLGGVFAVGDLVRGFTMQLEAGIEVSVFLEDDVTSEQQGDVQRTLTEFEVVDEVTYVSKEEAYEEFKQMFQDKPVMWENITPETLPASFRVTMADPERVDVIRSKLDRHPAVEGIEDYQDLANRITNFTSMLRTFSAVMILVLFVAAVLLISNTIQMAIFARRREIEIMKLVGATNWFVRVPFVMEGVAVGLLGSGIALSLLTLAKLGIRNVLPEFMPTPFFQVADPRHMLWLVLLGSVIGAIGSSVALRRYLDV